MRAFLLVFIKLIFLRVKTMRLFQNFFKKKKSLRRVSCIFCKERIIHEAKVCPHCGKFQNWKKFFDYSSPILALAVALVSVLSMGIPLIIKAYKADNSEVSIALINRDDVTIPVIASNKGSRLAVIDGLGVFTLKVVDNNKAEKDIHFIFNVLHNAKDIIEARDYLAIPEGISKQFYFQMLINEKLEVSDINQISINNLKSLKNQQSINIDNIKSCKFSINYINFDGTREKSDVAIYERSQLELPINEEQLNSEFMGSMGCVIKIPEPIRNKYGLFV